MAPDRQRLHAPGRGDPVGRAILVAFGVYLAALGLTWWAIQVFVPDHLTLSLFGHVLVRDRVHQHIVNRAGLFVLIMPAIFAFELALTGWAESSLRRLTVRPTRSSLTDLAVFFLSQTPIKSTVSLIVSLGLTLVSAAWLHHLLQRATGLSFSIAAMPVAAQMVLFFLVYSFFDYWSHRLDHAPLFWPLHRYHHSAEDFCVLTSVRVHPAAFTSLVGALPPLVLLWPSADVIALSALLIPMLRYLIHSRINSNFGFVGRWLLQSPTHHRLHHILDMSHATGHFSLCPLWDRLFGTWRHDADDADQSLVVGVAAPYRHGAWLVADMWRDYAEFWRGLGRLASPRPQTIGE
jgi:sterol desaturase/sphingolipid hydroxylase (fatty acid hydroxylase superfamily)